MSEDEVAVQVRAFCTLVMEGFIDRTKDDPVPAVKTKVQAQTERQNKKQKRKAAEGQLQVRRQEMDKVKVWRFSCCN
jgi:hypothetical protein